MMGEGLGDALASVPCSGGMLHCLDAKINFDISLIDYDVDVSWIQPKITEMKEVLDSENVPERNPYCEHCAYLEEGSKLINET